MQIKAHLSEDEAYTIMRRAFGGACNYWGRGRVWEGKRKMTVWEDADPNEITTTATGKAIVLGMNSLNRGVSLTLATNPSAARQIAMFGIAGADNFVVDSIVQCACFGMRRYG